MHQKTIIIIKTIGTMRQNLTNEQAHKAAQMMLESAEYCHTLAGATVFIPSIHTEKEGREENLKNIVSAIAEIVSGFGYEIEQGKLFTVLFDHLLCDAYFHVSNEVLEKMRSAYHTAPIYKDRKGNDLTLYEGLWHDGIREKLNMIYIDSYEPTGRHGNVERMEAQMQRRKAK